MKCTIFSFTPELSSCCLRQRLIQNCNKANGKYWGLGKKRWRRDKHGFLTASYRLYDPRNDQHYANWCRDVCMKEGYVGTTFLLRKTWYISGWLCCVFISFFLLHRVFTILSLLERFTLSKIDLSLFYSLNIKLFLAHPYIEI